MHRSCSVIILAALLACATAAAEDGDLTVPEARMLAQTQGDLRLGDVASLTPAVAAALAQHRGLVVGGTSANTLFLDGIREVSDEVADRLLQHEGPISMKGLTTLSHAGLTRKLLTCAGLGKATKITSPEAEAAIADSLAKAEASLVASLMANGQRGVTWPHESLSRQAAEVLASNSGPLALPHVTRLDAELAAVLARHSTPKDAGPNEFGMPGGLSLGLADVSPDIAESLAAHTGILTLDSVTRISPEAAAALSRHRGERLALGLTELDPATAEALANYAGGLAFTRLTTMSPETAAALAKHAGPSLELGLEDVRPDVAEALASYTGDIILDNVTNLTIEVVNRLAPHSGVLRLNMAGVPNGFDPNSFERSPIIGTELSEALAQHQGPVWVNYSYLPKPHENPDYLWGYNAGERQAAEWGEKRTKRVSEKFIREHAERFFRSEYAERFFRSVERLATPPPGEFGEFGLGDEDAAWELFWKGYQAAIQDVIDGKEPRTTARGTDGDAVPEEFGVPPNSRPPGSIPRRRPPADDR